MSNIKINNLTFGFPNQLTPIFENTYLDLESTWKLGLVGRNGRGKTTFLQLLMGNYSYTGELTHHLDFVYFPQKISDPSQLAYYALTESSDIEIWQLERELHLLHLDSQLLWKPFNQLSGGEQTKLLLACLFIDKNHYPLIDEPTNHLDQLGRQQVSDYLQKKQQGFIVISHDRHFLNNVTDHTLAIEKRQICCYKGAFKIYEQQKLLQDNYELEKNQQLKKEINRLKYSAKEKADWATIREKNNHGRNIAARMMKRSKAINQRTNQQIEAKSSLLKNIESNSHLKMNLLTTQHRLIFRATNFTLRRPEEKQLFKPISFELWQGEQLAILGANGIGKSSFFEFLQQPDNFIITGDFYQATDLSFSHVHQLTPLNANNLKDLATVYHANYTDLLNNLRKLGFEREQFETPIYNMSLGQQKKVAIAISIITPAHLYLWDEPLNYLDVFNQLQLQEMIQTYQPTLLFIDHDTDFIQQTASKTITLSTKK